MMVVSLRPATSVVPPRTKPNTPYAPVHPTFCRIRPHLSRESMIEPLESRTLFTLSVQVDYSLDSNHFFDDPNRRAILQAAFNTAVAYADTLDAIQPSGSNTWKVVLDDPSGGANVELDNLTIPANTLLVFVGTARHGLARHRRPRRVRLRHAGMERDRQRRAERHRIQRAQLRALGGSITFDSNPDAGWYFGLDGSASAIGHADR